jgi:hypothetical protein
MTHKTIDELFADEEAAALEKGRAEIAAEDAAWAALPPEQKLAIIAAREALIPEPVPCQWCGETEYHLSYCTVHIEENDDDDDGEDEDDETV